MQEFINFVSDFISGFASLLYNVFAWCLNGIKFIITGVFYMIFVGVFGFVTIVLNMIDLSVFVANWTAVWLGVPPQFIYVVNACGVPQCIVIVSTAIGIRMLLNLIPGALTRL